MPSANADLLRQMSLFFQWLWWRSDDVMGDALRGRHVDTPCTDVLRAFGKLRRDLRSIFGEAALTVPGDNWYDALLYTHMQSLFVFSCTSGGRRLIDAFPDKRFTLCCVFL